MKHHYSLSSILKFLIPSILGIFLFLFPIVIQGEITIPIAYLSNWLQGALGGNGPLIMVTIITITAVGTVITLLFEPKFILNSPFWTNLFLVTPLWAAIRVLGAIFAYLTYFKLGPEAIWSENTGGLLLGETGLLTILFSVFFFAGLLMPLLLDFGLLEFFGALLIKVMRPLFLLPGRSSIDALASWLGDGTIGVLLSSKQYEEGYYTQKEAAIIGTTFSIVSVTFSIIILQYVNLSHMFLPYYLTIVFAGLVAALIMPRIPPLSRKPNTFYKNQPGKDKEVIPEGYTPANWGFHQAIQQAKKNNSLKDFFIAGIKNVLDMWLGVAPVVMAIGTIGLVLAETTPIFEWLGIPFIPLLELMQVPEAEAASSTILVGFTDMLLPAILAEGIASDLTRFVIAALSVTQLIYLSEVGGLLLGSKIPVSFWDLVVIFLERTLITLPIIVMIAHFLF